MMPPPETPRSEPLPGDRANGAPPAPRGRASRRVAAWLLVPGMLVLSGCFDEPGIEETWTRVDALGANVANGAIVATGTAPAFSLHSTITFRRIVTGFAVADLRASSTLTAADVVLGPDAPRMRMAEDIDRILAQSVSVGRATRAVTGWDHLIQDVTFNFTGAVPAVVDSAGVPIGGTTGLFLIAYLGSGQRIERADGSETLLVTPFQSHAAEILPVGLELTLAGPAAPAAHAAMEPRR